MRTYFIAADGVKLRAAVLEGRVKSIEDAKKVLADIDPAVVEKAMKSKETQAFIEAARAKAEPRAPATLAVSDEELEELTAPEPPKAPEPEKAPEAPKAEGKKKQK